MLRVGTKMNADDILLQCGIPVAEQSISYMGRELVDPKKTVAQCGVQENSMILLRRRVVVAGRYVARPRSLLS